MKVNIICSEGNDGWIYSKFVREIKKYSKNEILLNSKEKCNIIYFIPYYDVFKTSSPSIAWFSHQELTEPLRSKFIYSSRQVDYCLSHSKKYASLLVSNGIKNVKQVMPGVDLDEFRLKSPNRNKNNKLVVGYVGRQYTSTNRKNPKLLDRIKKLDFVDFRMTGGKMSTEKIPEFYQNIDVVISPARIEGGPMAVTESLATGTPIVCYENVGVSNEFDDGVIRVPFDREDLFIKRLEDMWKNKDHMGLWRDLGQMHKMRAQIELFSWRNFVSAHDEVFELICK